MQGAVYPKPNPNIIALVFDMDITGTQKVCLVDQVVQNIIGLDRVERFADHLERVAVALFGDFISRFLHDMRQAGIAFEFGVGAVTSKIKMFNAEAVTGAKN